MEEEWMGVEQRWEEGAGEEGGETVVDMKNKWKVFNKNKQTKY